MDGLVEFECGTDSFEDSCFAFGGFELADSMKYSVTKLNLFGRVGGHVSPFYEVIDKGIHGELPFELLVFGITNSR